MNIPKWAQELTINTIIHLQSKGYKSELPELKWRHGKHRSSSGICCQHDHITITAGHDRKDSKLVLLHELAHWVLPDNEHHGDNFWRLAFDLYKFNGLPVRYCINRESNETHTRSKARIKRLAKGE